MVLRKLATSYVAAQVVADTIYDYNDFGDLDSTEQLATGSIFVGGYYLQDKRLGTPSTNATAVVVIAYLIYKFG